LKEEKKLQSIKKKIEPKPLVHSGPKPVKPREVKEVKKEVSNKPKLTEQEI
jgi:hypothetical protein